DEVLIMFGFLTLTYTEMLKGVSGEDEVMITAIMHSLEKHWGKVDQEVFVAAVILNPMYKTRPFFRNCKFTHAGIYLLLIKLWKHFYCGMDPPVELQREMMDYLQGVGDYEGMDAWVQATIQNSAMNHQQLDPIPMYESISFPDQELTPLKKLAWHIFAICANSASCEHLFSKFGLILTQLCSCMQLKNLLNTTELALHL
ncbi:hypothetical protein SCLCIDRAFT_109864, partial [Scleroderma citrinum Foug A]